MIYPIPNVTVELSTPCMTVDIQQPTLDVNINDVVIQVISAEPYEGDYEITPTIAGFTMLTENKLMEEDVIVKPIPYKQTSNPQGGNTVFIGSSLD